MEQVVTERVFGMLETGDLAPYLKGNLNGAEGELVQSVQADEAMLDQFTIDYADGVLDRGQLLAAQARVKGRLEVNRRRLVNHSRSAVMGALAAGPTVRAQWDSRPLEWRRSVLVAIVDHVTLLPAPKRGVKVFNPDLVQVTWRT